jgi:hypothetical protein
VTLTLWFALAALIALIIGAILNLTLLHIGRRLDREADMND